ncbi:pimeloyl-ACP methyl ester carboxylesterase [Kitasatospora gansuensis]|uniref:Pimeloyl-ACP methyl ester carboxylesterase n=1 Tax=Kitasatospora gansuensis TaxID=258050 RepID=A0A7W7WJG5_9ACTN|nr:alpha/beta hydrolase [Kitasatospora gansuensis]MBB4949138.1 pimeloyl-ACP methyl ester carboxylesterase [Kitasatospora gansuensis]
MNGGAVNGARFVRVGGRAVHTVVSGRGPVVVLSGGLGCCWFDWDRVVPLLEPHRTVVRFDRPGFGLSEPVPGPPTARGEADRIAALLDALAVDTPVTVVGHSIAAFHVEAFARLHPARTAALVLLDGSTEPAARPSRAQALRELTVRTLGGLATATAVPYLLGPVARRAAGAANTLGHRDPAPAELVRRCYRTSRSFRALLAENTHYLDVAAELNELRRTRPSADAPAIVLAASTGRGGRAWLARQRELAAVLDAEFRLAVPSGHLLMEDRPGDVAAAVLDAPGP